MIRLTWHLLFRKGGGEVKGRSSVSAEGTHRVEINGDDQTPPRPPTPADDNPELE